ncbi:hypothetical protein [Celerinatantimonas diazotrophica]|uniref:Uncharacterized protein n=1 Tax=Celerinatantimonas diazotrophica TaxID=412034 RepID=A0A4R1JLS6_9GAMM|nr:hypothetical protein [Celerinatantimonas diazotrophica]TCK51993.1 hypothetical protein EV690_2093 [Celerinatantimonas diazotrophica]CAG9296304.1 hypothetical protein CEDIAZO_01452 [Celerinatantimonas diazotrophica]
MSVNHPRIEDVQELKMHSDALVSQMMTYGAQCIDEPLLREKILYGTQIWCSQIIERYQRSPQANKAAIIAHFQHKTTQLSIAGGQLSAIKNTADHAVHSQQSERKDSLQKTPSIQWVKDDPMNTSQKTHIPDINNEIDQPDLKPWEKDTSSLEQKLNNFNNKVNSPVGFIVSAAQIKAANKLATEQLMFTDELMFYRTVVRFSTKWGKITGGVGIFIVLGSTLFDEYSMWKDGASTQEIEIRALGGILDFMAAVIGLASGWGFAGTLIYYGVEMGMAHEGINQNPLIYLYEHELKGVLEYVEDLL